MNTVQCILWFLLTFINILSLTILEICNNNDCKRYSYGNLSKLRDQRLYIYVLIESRYVKMNIMDCLKILMVNTRCYGTFYRLNEKLREIPTVTSIILLVRL